MKTLGRILIILAAFAAVMGITYVIANAVSANSSSTSANVTALEQGDNGQPRPDREQPELAEGRPDSDERPNFGRDGRRGGGWMFGLTRNIGIVALIVALIAVPRSLLRKKPVPAPAK